MNNVKRHRDAYYTSRKHVLLIIRIPEIRINPDTLRYYSRVYPLYSRCIVDNCVLTLVAEHAADKIHPPPPPKRYKCLCQKYYYVFLEIFFYVLIVILFGVLFFK